MTVDSIDTHLDNIRENLNSTAGARLARIEAFKAAFLVLAFLAIGFAVGFHVATTRCSVPPVWSAWI
jgi:hypothetical protein